MPTPLTHPHLFLEKTMTSVPKVKPGDAVFWHCDVIHSVEEEHTGKEDSAGETIPVSPNGDFTDILPQSDVHTVGPLYTSKL